MRLVARFPEFRFETTVAPVRRVEGNAERSRHLTAEEVAETAEWLKAATGSHRQPYVLRSVEHHTHPDDRFRGVDMPAPDALFRHRTAARRHQVLTEIETTRM
jgi:pyruvate formate lyase activating enzyme